MNDSLGYLLVIPLAVFIVYVVAAVLREMIEEMGAARALLVAGGYVAMCAAAFTGMAVLDGVL